MFEYSSIPQISDLSRCRLCFDNQTSLIHIFETTGSLNEVARSISEVLNFEVSAEDHFPPFVCSYCSTKLFDFKAFKAKCYSLRETYKLSLQRRAESVREVCGGMPVAENNESKVFLERNVAEPNHEEVSLYNVSPLLMKVEDAVVGDGIGVSEQIEAEQGPKDSAFNVAECPIKTELDVGEMLEDAEMSKEVENDQIPEGHDDSPQSRKQVWFQMNPSESEVYVSSEQSDAENVPESSNYHLDGYPISNRKLGAEGEVIYSRTCSSVPGMDFPVGAADVTIPVMADKSSNVVNDPLEGIDNDSEISIKDEMDIVEWEMPQDMLPKEDILEVSAGIDFKHNYAAKNGQTEELEELQSTKSCNINSLDCLAQMDMNYENVFSKNSSSVVSPSGISGANKEICEKSVKDDLFIKKETFFSLKSKNGDNSAKSGSSSSGMAVQTKRKPFACDICNNSFVRKRSLGDHVRVHYDDRPYKCRDCGVSFKREYTKTVHELTHLKKQKENGGDGKRKNKKSYVCEICKKEFSRQDSLYKHSNLHKNKYSCTFCGRRFSSKQHLNQHLRIHTNEKPFSCEVCKRTFNQKGNLKTHITTHSDDFPFQCNVCDKRFKTKHLKNHHELFHLRSK